MKHYRVLLSRNEEVLKVELVGVWTSQTLVGDDGTESGATHLQGIGPHGSDDIEACVNADSVGGAAVVAFDLLSQEGGVAGVERMRKGGHQACTEDTRHIMQHVLEILTKRLETEARLRRGDCQLPASSEEDVPPEHILQFRRRNDFISGLATTIAALARVKEF